MSESTPNQNQGRAAVPPAKVATPAAGARSAATIATGAGTRTAVPSSRPSAVSATPATRSVAANPSTTARRRRETPKTRKLNLDRAYIHSGTVYGPGLVDVPEGDVADDIEDKQQYLQEQGQPSPAVSEVLNQAPALVEQLPGGQQNTAPIDPNASSVGSRPAEPAHQETDEGSTDNTDQTKEEKK